MTFVRLSNAYYCERLGAGDHASLSQDRGHGQNGAGAVLLSGRVFFPSTVLREEIRNRAAFTSSSAYFISYGTKSPKRSAGFPGSPKRLQLRPDQRSHTLAQRRQVLFQRLTGVAQVPWIRNPGNTCCSQFDSTIHSLRHRRVRSRHSLPCGSRSDF